jgi:hypothetical protein
VAVDVEKGDLVWRDLGQFHSYEGFFSTSLKTFAELNRKINPRWQPEEYRSSLDVLDSDEIVTDCIYPTGFIFHAGRCGSTLLLKSLAKSRRHLVIGEADVHNGIWSQYTRDWTSPPEPNENNIRQYRRLILATGRRRLATHQSYFVKFTSFNILMLEFIRRAFPDVPALFLYRTPPDILSSFNRTAPKWADIFSNSMRSYISGTDSGKMCILSRADFYQNALRNFLSAAVKAEATGLSYLNYESLSPSNLPLVLRHFNVETVPEDLAKMQAQFEYDAKTEYSLRRFNESGIEIHRTRPMDVTFAAGNEALRLYEYMTRSNMNIVKGHTSDSED